MSQRRRSLHTAVLETTWGDITIGAGERGVAACGLPPAPARPVPFRVIRVRLTPGAPDRLRRAARYARAVLEGRPAGRCPKLGDDVWFEATAFQRAAWEVLRAIPRGKTVTYGELARMAGHPGAARAAGSACGANPWPLFIPCHRVVAAGGGLGGFSAGRAWKKWLLASEGVER